MSDRLALANAIEDAGIERAKAERIATVIFDVIHENVATKADVQGAEARLNAQIAAVRADLTLVEHRLMTRLGARAAKRAPRRSTMPPAAPGCGRRQRGPADDGIVTTHYRYERPPLKRKAAAIEAPVIVSRVSKRSVTQKTLPTKPKAAPAAINDDRKSGIVTVRRKGRADAPNLTPEGSRPHGRTRAQPPLAPGVTISHMGVAKASMHRRREIT